MVNNDFYLNNASYLNNTSSSFNTRLGWLDLMRIMACFLVVLSHAVDIFSDNDFDTSMFIKLIAKPSIPLFVMVSSVGILPLKPQYLNISFFYRKRLLRILIPLIFWSILLPVIGYFIFVGVYLGEQPSVLFSLGRFHAEGLPQNIWTWIFTYHHFTYAYWFLYMLIGLYLIIPILNKWLINSTEKEIRTLLIVWIITLFLPYYRLIAKWNGFDNTLGINDWNDNDTFYYVSGYVGYLVLAFYLVKYPIQLTLRNKFLFIASWVVSYVFTVGMLIWTHYTKEDTWQYVLVLESNLNINTVMLTLPIFVFIQNLKLTPSRFLKILASLTFGIYLIHVPLEWLFGYLIQLLELPMVPSILIVAFLVFISAGVITWILRQWKLTRKLVG